MTDMDVRLGTIALTESPVTERHFSHSQFNMYMRCSMQYMFRYVMGLKERPNLNLVNGLSGHEAVETHLGQKILSQTEPPRDVILDAFDSAWTRRIGELEPSDLRPDDNPANTKDSTYGLLNLYHAIESPKIIPKMVEIPFRLVIPDAEDEEPLPPIVGRIDEISHRVEAGVERSQTKDQKFVSRDNKKQADIDYSSQMDLYDLVMDEAGVPTDDLGLQIFVPRTKTNPTGKIVPLIRSAELMTPERRQSRRDRLIYKMRTVWRAIRLGIFVPTDNPMICSWCGFRERCQASLVKDDYTAMTMRQKSGEPPA